MRRPTAYLALLSSVPFGPSTDAQIIRGTITGTTQVVSEGPLQDLYSVGDGMVLTYLVETPMPELNGVRYHIDSGELLVGGHLVWDFEHVPMGVSFFGGHCCTPDQFSLYSRRSNDIPGSLDFFWLDFDARDDDREVFTPPPTTHPAEVHFGDFEYFSFHIYNTSFRPEYLIFTPDSYTVEIIPEPATLSLLAVGLCALVMRRRSWTPCLGQRASAD